MCAGVGVDGCVLVWVCCVDVNRCVLVWVWMDVCWCGCGWMCAGVDALVWEWMDVLL